MTDPVPTDEPLQGAAMPPDGETSPRLDQFRAEVANLKVRGGAAEPERWATVLGLLLAVAGVGLGVIAYNKSHHTQKSLDQGDAFIVALVAVSVTVIGAVLWLRNSLTRWFRYWLLRLVYEDREQTDRLIATLDRIDGHLARLDRGPGTAAGAAPTPSDTTR